jgi:hypothetical protein
MEAHSKEGAIDAKKYELVYNYLRSITPIWLQRILADQHIDHTAIRAILNAYTPKNTSLKEKHEDPEKFTNIGQMKDILWVCMVLKSANDDLFRRRFSDAVESVLNLYDIDPADDQFFGCDFTWLDYFLRFGQDFVEWPISKTELVELILSTKALKKICI